mgnify:CR=1 FL=1
MNLKNDQEKEEEKSAEKDSGKEQTLQEINELRELAGFPPLDPIQKKSHGLD